MTSKKPQKDQIRDLVKSDSFKWFLERIAIYLNSIDTVRNVENGSETVARQLAITMIENAFKDIFEEGELAELQKKVSEDEELILNKFKNLKEEY